MATKQTARDFNEARKKAETAASRQIGLGKVLQAFKSRTNRYDRAEAGMRRGPGDPVRRAAAGVSDGARLHQMDKSEAGDDSRLKGAAARQLEKDVSWILSKPAAEKKALLAVLVEKLKQGSPDDAISRLEALRLVLQQKLSARAQGILPVDKTQVLLALASLYADKKNHDAAENAAGELLLAHGLGYPQRIEATLVMCGILRQQKQYGRAWANLAGCIELYRLEAMSRFKDDRMKEKIAKELSALMHDLAENGITVDQMAVLAGDKPRILPGMIAAYTEMSAYDASADFVRFALRNDPDRAQEIGALLLDKDIPLESRKKIVSAFLAAVKVNAGSITPALALNLAAGVRRYRKEDSSNDVWALLGYLNAVVHGKVWMWSWRLVRARRKASVSPEASFYMARAGKYFADREYGKALADLDRAQALDAGVKDTAAFKNIMFNSRMAPQHPARTVRNLWGVRDVFRRKKTLEDEILARISALDAAKPAAYDAATKEEVGSAVFGLCMQLIDLYESRDKNVTKKYNSWRALNQARADTFFKMAAVARDIALASDTARKRDMWLGRAVNMYEKVLLIEPGNDRAKSGIAEVRAISRASEIAGRENGDFDGRMKYYMARAYMELAGEDGISFDARKELLEKAMENVAGEGDGHEELFRAAALDVADLHESEGKPAEAAAVLGKAIGRMKKENVSEDLIKPIEARLEALNAEIVGSDNVADRVIALIVNRINTEIQRVTVDRALDSDRRKAKIESLASAIRALRGLYSDGTGQAVKLGEEGMKYAREARREKTVITDADNGAIYSAVESALRSMRPRTDKAGIEKCEAICERLLKQGRNQELLWLKDILIRNNIRSNKLTLYELKARIAMAEKALNEKRDNDVLDIEYEFAHLVSGFDHRQKDLKADARILLAQYYGRKAGRTGGKNRKKARAMEVKYFTLVLQSRPFSLEALRGLAGTEGSENKILTHFEKNILRPKQRRIEVFEGMDDAEREKVIEFVMAQSWKLKKAGEARYLGVLSGMFGIAGQISPDFACKIIDFCFQEKMYAPLAVALSADYETADEYTRVLGQLNSRLAGTRFDQLSGIDEAARDAIIVALDGIKSRVVKGRQPDCDRMDAQIAIARAYVLIAAKQFIEANTELEYTKALDSFTDQQVGVARIKARLAAGEKFRMWGAWARATRKLSPESVSALNADWSRVLKETAKQKREARSTATGWWAKTRKGLAAWRADLTIEKRLVEAAWRYPGNMQAHQELKDYYHNSGRHGDALCKIVDMVEIALDERDHEKVKAIIEEQVVKEDTGVVNAYRAHSDIWSELSALAQSVNVVLPNEMPPAVAESRFANMLAAILGPRVGTDVGRVFGTIHEYVWHGGFRSMFSRYSGSIKVNIDVGRGKIGITGVKSPWIAPLAEITLGICAFALVLGFSAPTFTSVASAVAFNLFLGLVPGIVNFMAGDNFWRTDLLLALRQVFSMPPPPEDLPDWLNESGPVIVVGLVGYGADLTKLRQRFPDYENVRFVALERDAARARQALGRAVSGRAAVGVMVDIGDRAAEDNIDLIVEGARSQAVAMIAPYLKPGSISNLTRPQLNRSFGLIASALPAAAPQNLDYVVIPQAEPPVGYETVTAIMGAAAPEGAVGSPSVTGEAGYPSPENTGEWVPAFMDALSLCESTGGRAGRNTVEAMRYDLMRYLTGLPAPAARALLARHEAAATARYWRDRNEPAALDERLLDEAARVSRRAGPQVLAFDADLLEDADAVASVRALVRAAEGRDFVRVVVFGAAPDEAAVKRAVGAGVTVVARDPRRTLTAQLRAEAGGDADVCVAMMETAEALAAVEADVGAAGEEEMSSFLVIGSGAKLADVALGELAVANLLQAAMQKAPSFIGLGVFRPENASALGRIEALFSQTGGSFRMMTDVGQVLTEVFTALKQIATSL
ncbi:MAG: hypothetical protein ABH885_05890 [Candidatus Omnitrophota bacterium]